MYALTRLKKRVRAVIVGLAASAMVLGNVASVAALSSSSLSLSDPRPSETGVTYTFDSSGFDTGTALECIQLVFTVNADGTGGTPAGMDASGADMVSSTLITETNWDAGESHTAGTLQATYATGETPNASGNLVFNTVTNPNTDDTFFVTFTTYSDDTCSTSVDSVVVAFSTKDGTPVSLTIEPSLTFTTAGVASGSVNGATITHTSVGSSIDYLNDVSSSTNGVSAHDIQISSNATGGYTVYVRHTGQLTSGGDTIDNHTGTNLSPSNLGTGTEAWGYTTEDATLTATGDGADRFTNPGNEWAGFTTGNEEVVYNAAAPTGTETTRVGHQVAVTSDTEAGTYTTTLVYTVVATF